VVDDAEAQFLAFFAGKTVGMIRAPDSYVYPAPFNIIEVVFIAPFEPCLSSNAYAKLNRRVMMVLFFIPLIVVALFETTLDINSNKYMRHWVGTSESVDVDDKTVRDPQIGGNGPKISKVSFDEIVKAFPDVTMSEETHILNELATLRAQMDILLKRLDGKQKA